MIVVDRRPAAVRLLEELDAHPDGGWARVLAPWGSLYAAGAALHRRLRPDLPLPAEPPSLGIGNVRVGGTGKTPLVEDLGRRLMAEGHRVGVLTRGYRGRSGGDEPGWLDASGLRVYADPDRARGFDRAREDGMDRLLLDDALQTRFRPRWVVAIVLERDLARAPRPLPAGPAREGPAGLQRADAVFVRREGERAVRRPGSTPGFRLRPAGFVGSDGREADAPEGPGVLVSGLARPGSFEADARGCGLDLRGSWREPDHWSPGPDAAAALDAFAVEQGARWILVPEKNLERCATLALSRPVFALRSRIEWDDGLDPLGWLRERGLRI